MPVLLTAPLPPSSPPRLPPRHPALPSGLAAPWLGAPLPLHSTSSTAKPFCSSAPCYLLPTRPPYSHVLCHFAKRSWDYLGTAPTRRCSALQRRNPGFIKLNLIQWRTAREMNFKMFPLKITVSKLCTVYHNQWFCDEKAIPPSRGLPGEVPQGQAGGSQGWTCSLVSLRCALSRQ